MSLRLIMSSPFLFGPLTFPLLRARGLASAARIGLDDGVRELRSVPWLGRPESPFPNCRCDRGVPPGFQRTLFAIILAQPPIDLQRIAARSPIDFGAHPPSGFSDAPTG